MICNHEFDYFREVIDYDCDYIVFSMNVIDYDYEFAIVIVIVPTIAITDYDYPMPAVDAADILWMQQTYCGCSRHTVDALTFTIQFFSIFPKQNYQQKSAANTR